MFLFINNINLIDSINYRLNKILIDKQLINS